MKQIAVINQNTCDRSPFCPVKRVCPVGAVTQARGQVPVIDPDKCTGCSICVTACPMRAVILEDVE